MTHIAILATACLLFPLGCTDSLTDSLTSTNTGREATTLDVEPDSTTLAREDSVQLEATPRDAQGTPVSGYAITWASENTAVATVESGGVVVAHRSGSARITASATNGDSEPLSSRSKIAVDDGEALITNVTPAEYVISTTAVGEEVYVDREPVLNDIPSTFEGWTYVRTADDDKSNEDESAVTLTLTDTATVALAYDERATALPRWLDNWTNTGKMLGTTGVDYDIFTRVFGPGEVVLGGNQSSGAEGAQRMYVLFAAPSNSLPDEDDELTIGDLQVSASTSGDPSDSDGYTVTVNDSISKKIGPDESVRFSDLVAGDHQVELSGIQSNCSVDGSNPRTVSVEAGNTASTNYSVNCTSSTGSLEVSASTTGDDPDSDGYTATVDGDASKEIGPNGSATFSDLDAGEHEVELSGIKSNCSVDGSNPRTVSVEGGITASTAFEVGCEPVSEPTVESATINSDGTQITLAFDQAVALGPNHEDAHLNPIDDTPHDNPTMSFASGEGTSSLVFDLSRTFLQGESPSIHYDQPGDGLQASDSGADVSTFSEFAVTNNSTQGKTIEVSVSTSGDDPDTDGYTVTVDGDESEEIGPNGTVTFSDLGVGDHQVELSGIKANCSVEGQNPRSVAIEVGNTASTSYSVNCASTAGALEVSTATSGDDPDSDGYTVTVDGDASKEIQPNGTVTFSGLDQGEHQVELTGVADNCSVEDSNPRTVSVEGGTTTSTDYAVSCTATTGDLEVSTSTSGADPDPDGYTVMVDGDASKEIGPNGSVTFSSLDAGEHEVELTGVANNCSVDGSNPRTVSVEAGNTASTSYNVSCTSTTGSLEVSASTTGDDQDSDGYTATVDGDDSKDLDPNGTVTFSDLSEGKHEVELSGIQSNCSVDGANPRTVDVEGGSTASTAFDVGCEAVSEPTIESATINEAGSQITLAFDQAVSLGPNYEDAHLNPIDDTPNDNPTMSFASGEGSSSLVFDLSRTFLEGESPSIHYDQPGDGLQASDSGADLPTFSEFAVTNNSTQGDTLAVSVSTSGDDQDTNGYTVTIDGDASKEIDPNGSVTFAELSEGDHQIELSGIKSNCSVDGQNPRTVSVTGGGTASTSFDVSCTSTIQAVEIPDQSDFTDHGKILDGADCGEWDWWLQGPATVIKHNGTLYFYYVGMRGDRPNIPGDPINDCSTEDRDEANRFLGLAESTDNRNFSRNSDNPLIEHQPGDPEENDLSFEGGVLEGASLGVENGTFKIYFGGLEEHNFENVDSDVVYVDSPDGVSWGNQQDAARNGEFHSDGITPGWEELYPSGAINLDGTYHLYYTGQDDGNDENWSVYHTSSSDETDYGTTGKAVSGLGGGDGIGVTGEVIRVADDKIIIPFQKDPGPNPIDIHSAPTSDLTDLTTIEDTWDWGGEVNEPKLFLDREAEEWLLFYRYMPNGESDGDNEIHLKTAPVTYK